MKKKTDIISKANGDTCPKASRDKPLTELMKKVWDQGARFKETKSGWMIYPPDLTKDGVLIHLTNSDHRALKNARGLLKDRGFEV